MLVTEKGLSNEEVGREVSTSAVEHCTTNGGIGPAAELPIDRFDQERMDLTAEYQLWQAALGTFVLDAKAMTRGSWNPAKEQRAQAVLSQMNSAWVCHVCDLIGLPHERLVGTVSKMINEAKAKEPRYSITKRKGA